MHVFTQFVNFLPARSERRIGLFTPFAVIRSHKYRLQSVTAVTVTGMDQFLGSASVDQVAATGEGAADLFDFDIGL